MSLAGFGSPSLSQLNQLSNALHHHHHHHPVHQSGGGIMSSTMNGYQTSTPAGGYSNSRSSSGVIVDFGQSESLTVSTQSYVKSGGGYNSGYEQLLGTNYFSADCNNSAQNRRHNDKDSYDNNNQLSPAHI